MKTIGDLRKTIEGMHDECPVLLRPNKQATLAAQGTTTWEADNAYQSKDKRFNPENVLVIEGGNLAQGGQHHKAAQGEPA